jgi:hypothetical protein
VIFFTGCVVTHNPKTREPKIDPVERNWTEIYKQEIQTAIKNEDYEAYYFFIQELIKDSYRDEYGEEMYPNPSLKFLK